MKKIIILCSVIFITACSTQSSLNPKEKIYLTIDIRKELILEEVYKNVKDKLKYPEAPVDVVNALLLSSPFL